MNRNLRLLRTLYTSASAKYYKLKIRYEKRVQNNTFHQLTKRKQYALVSQLKKLYERLKSLHALLRVAAAGSVVALTLAANDSQAQGLGPFTKNNAANPLPAPLHVNHPRIAMVDIDNDGDLDAIIGNASGDLQFFRNDSPEGEVRRFIEVTGTDNPFNGINKGYHAAPALADIDGDGDLDLFLGVDTPFFNPPGGPNQYDYSPTFFFRNTGSATNPVFTEQTGTSNPFDEIYATKYGAGIPTFVDIDDDDDLDLFLGSSYTSDMMGAQHFALQYFENQGTPTNPNFVAASHPLETSNVQYMGDVNLTFADFDGDGDLDAVVGQYSGGYGVRALRNDGSSFTLLSPSESPAYGIYARLGSPVFADVDGDDDLDLVVGQTSGNELSLTYSENIGEFEFERRNGLNISPFGGVDVERDAAPTFVDLDNDGDLDAVIGSKYSSYTLSVFTNENGLFIADIDHPLHDFIDFGSIVPSFVDIDNDGDLDLFYGNREIQFIRNTGTASNPEFEQTEINFFPTLTSSNAYDLSITFIDADGDGDQDAFVGNDHFSQTGVQFFRNTGTANNAQFEAAALPGSFGSAFEYNPNVAAVDLDNDGDLDLIVTDSYEYVTEGYASRARFFSNENGVFEEMDGVIIGEVSTKSLITFADIDGDGDKDAFVGNGNNFEGDEEGKITYFENTNPAPVTEVSLNTVSVSLNTPAVLDPDLTISDADDDGIVQATVTISNYAEGNEILDVTENPGITVDFEDGVLTLRGRASREEYETMLRTVTYEFTGNVTAGRLSARAGVPPQGKTVTFSVRDIDFTETVVSQVNVITLNLIGEPVAGITVYNAVSPGLVDGLNDYMRITGLPANNKVSIFNRWGDKVFEVSGYDNVDKRFEGKTDSGKDLPTGTYYYLIELKDRKIDGFISLKR